MMKSCIYYDLPVVSQSELARARAAAGGDKLEIAASTARWVGDEGAWLPERLVSSHVLSNQDRAMAWIEQLRVGFEDAGVRLSRHGASLFEVARYDFFAELVAWEHRWWVAQEIRRRWAPDRLLWVARPERRHEHRWLVDLTAALSQDGLRAEYHGHPPSCPRHQDLLSTVKARLFALRDRVSPLVRRRSRRPSAPILFTDYYPNNVKSMLPVAAQLEREHGQSVSWLAGRCQVVDALAEQGLASYMVDDYVSLGTILRGRLTTAERAALDSAMTRTAEPWLARIAGPMLLRALDAAAFAVEAYHSAFTALRPEVVVSAVYSGISGRAAATQARAHGGRSVYVQHGLFPDSFIFSFFMNDRKLMWGEYERRSLLRFGHAPDSVRVTGSAQYDDCREVPPPAPAGGPLRVAYLPTRSIGISLPTAETMLRAVVEAARALGAVLTVKPHPGDRSRVPEEVLRDHPDVRLVRGGDAGDVIRANDVVIIVLSTAGNEACLAGRPLITFNMDATAWEDVTEFAHYGAALAVSRPEDLTDALRRIRDDEGLRVKLAAGRRRLLDDMLDGARGQASRRVAEEIIAERGRRDRIPAPGAGPMLRPYFAKDIDLSHELGRKGPP